MPDCHHHFFCSGFCPEYRYNNKKSLPRWTVDAPPTIMEKMMCFYPEASGTVHTVHDRPRDHNRIRNPSQIGEFCYWSIFACNIANQDAEKFTKQTKSCYCHCPPTLSAWCEGWSMYYWSGEYPKTLKSRRLCPSGKSRPANGRNTSRCSPQWPLSATLSAASGWKVSPIG